MGSSGCASSVQVELPTQFDVVLSTPTSASSCSDYESPIDSRQLESGTRAMRESPNQNIDWIQSRSTISTWDSVPLESVDSLVPQSSNLNVARCQSRSTYPLNASDSKTVSLELE